MKYLKQTMFLLILFFLLSFYGNLKTVYATDNNLTDIEKINDGFLFSEDTDTDMSFKALDSGDDESFWGKIYDNYKVIIIGGLSIAISTFFILFIINIMKLNTSSGNPEARKRCLNTLLWTGIACALLGGVTFLMAFSQAMFK